MSGRECYHCKQWVEEGEAQRLLDNDRGGADRRPLGGSARRPGSGCARPRPSSATNYASHESIVFARESWYCLVRPKRTFLELCVFLGHAVKAPQVRRVDRASKSKLRHTIPVRHRDELEPPITDWLAEAYEFCGTAVAAGSRGAGSGTPGDS